MKKSLCLFVSVVSSCSFFVSRAEPVVEETVQVKKPLTMQQLLRTLEEETPKKREILFSPKTAAAVAAGIATTACSKPVAHVLNPQPVTRGVASIAEYLIMVGIGGGLTGFAVYAFIGNEMSTIVNFKSTLKKLNMEIKNWYRIITELQSVQDEQTKKITEAQMHIEQMLPLMQHVVEQSSNEQVLAKTLQHLYVECAGMLDRIKTLETILIKAAALNNATDEKDKIKQAKLIKRLIKKSNEFFGQPEADGDVVEKDWIEELKSFVAHI